MLPTLVSWSIQGKRVVITGASRGIGRAAARDLAAMGADLTLIVRDRGRGEQAAEELRAVPGAGDVDLFFADLSLMQDIRRVAAEVSARHEKIHVLLNNAGGVWDKRELTREGLEHTFAINHIAYFLLTRLLIEPIKRAGRDGGARIVSVASDAHRTVFGIQWDDLAREYGYFGWGVYAETKLMNVLFAAELARRLEGTGVTSNSLHPGTVNTNFSKDGGGFLISSFFKVFGNVIIDDAQGASTSVYLASSSDVEDVTGAYFERRRRRWPTAAARDPYLARRLWTESCRITGLPEEL